ncbi:MAG TPA: ComF family protein [Chloroflexi bacterium]|nr:ComF family protein [Chloroflexota bacterium]
MPNRPQASDDESSHRRWYHTLLDLVYPPHCVACGQPGAWLCTRCIQKASAYHPPVCPHCGTPVSPSGACHACAGPIPCLAGVRVVGPYRPPLRQAIHALKYEGMRVLAAPLGAMLATAYRTHALTPRLVVPVPLHPARIRQRGYNQALLLARETGRRLDLILHEKALVRRRDTPSQVGLGRSARRANVYGAFSCPATDVAGESLLLIDDVVTTGATLEACALPLLEAGAKAVWALVVARALYRQSDDEPHDRPDGSVD